MPRIARTLFSICLLFAAGLALAQEPGGTLSGQVDYCGTGGVDGMQVYVPGRQYVVVTDKDGRFLLENLPVGEYRLVYRFGDKILKRADAVNVAAAQAIDLGVVSFCDRAQLAPVVTATAKECGAQEGDIPAILVANGTGTCKGGKVVVEKCDKWFADCDNKPANGCETDIKHDDLNCGGCGNACTPGEVCAMGFC
jgi:hypothetical protein